MKLHLFSPGHHAHPRHTDEGRNQDRFYALMFVIGAPSAVIGSMYLVDLVFNLVWR
ncbi:hypothetical protein [Herbaspirillum sp. ST 5-3]|uniref:hypothetical protein n=1 Tax=Oxalobacteraceae TaxID=75682 RepID=UPI00145603B6|nr:hypothetical protein [Herbaspirillum sp. ST 5-3]